MWLQKKRKKKVKAWEIGEDRGLILFDTRHPELHSPTHLGELLQRGANELITGPSSFKVKDVGDAELISPGSEDYFNRATYLTADSAAAALSEYLSASINDDIRYCETAPYLRIQYSLEFIQWSKDQVTLVVWNTIRPSDEREGSISNFSYIHMFDDRRFELGTPKE